MKQNLLILDAHSEKYRRLLEPNFPDVRFHTANHLGEIGDVIKKTHVLFAIGHRFGEDLVRKAPKLEWIQSLITGTDTVVALKSLKKEVG